MTDPTDYEQAVADINRPNEQLRAYAHRSRRLIWAGFAAIVILVALAAAIAYTAVRVNRDDLALARQSQTIYATCVARNASRAKLVQVFTYLLDNRTASSTNQPNAASIAYVRSQFPQGDCGPKPR